MSTQKLKDLLAEYGGIALSTYLGVFFVVLAGFAAAIASGIHVGSAAGGTGLLGAAWLATKLTQPLRIAATLALTPIVARVLRRFRAPERGEARSEPEASD